jgi:hypothetical protein
MDDTHVAILKVAQSLLVRPTEIWLPTPLGWLVLGGSAALIGLWLSRRLYPFLAVNTPTQASLLVVDGWMPDYALEQVYAEFYAGSYQQIVALGTSIGRGHYLIDYKSYADVAAATLIALGIPASQIAVVSVAGTTRYRTHNTALALKQWLESDKRTVQSINLCTLGAHARRSRLLFRRNLAPKVKVGVIALEPLEYEPNRWWQSSAGGRAVIGELIAYLYTCFTLPWITPYSDAVEP